MEWIEADPLPPACQDCQEEDCYNCDHAGERWTLSQADELRIKRKGLMTATKASKGHRRRIRGIGKWLKLSI